MVVVRRAARTLCHYVANTVVDKPLPLEVTMALDILQRFAANESGKFVPDTTGEKSGEGKSG